MDDLRPKFSRPLRLNVKLQTSLLAIMLLAVTGSFLHADVLNPTVGAPGYIEDLVLPGSELIGKPITKKEPMIVRVVKAIKHGNGYRYEIRFQGLEAGKFNLADWLVRKDGSSTEGLPEIEVEIQSLLAPGQIVPNELEAGWIPRLGGYRNVAAGIAILWGLVLLGLIFIRKSKTKEIPKIEKQVSLADLLFARLSQAQGNELSQDQYAELERMLFGFWCNRLHLNNVPMNEAMQNIKQHEVAGPLMMQLEQWMHSPRRDDQLDLSSLVKPYRDMPIEDTDSIRQQLNRGQSGASK